LHPWLRESIPFYIEIFNQNNRIENQTRINEEVLKKLAALPNVNFNGLSDDKVRRAIRKHEDFSFVVAYKLLLDEFTKKQLLSENKLLI